MGAGEYLPFLGGPALVPRRYRGVPSSSGRPEGSADPCALLAVTSRCPRAPRHSSPEEEEEKKNVIIMIKILYLAGKKRAQEGRIGALPTGPGALSPPSGCRSERVLFQQHRRAHNLRAHNLRAPAAAILTVPSARVTEKTAGERRWGQSRRPPPRQRKARAQRPAAAAAALAVVLLLRGSAPPALRLGLGGAFPLKATRGEAASRAARLPQPAPATRGPAGRQLAHHSSSSPQHKVIAARREPQPNPPRREARPRAGPSGASHTGRGEGSGARLGPSAPPPRVSAAGGSGDSGDSGTGLVPVPSCV